MLIHSPFSSCVYPQCDIDEIPLPLKIIKFKANEYELNLTGIFFFPSKHKIFLAQIYRDFNLNYCSGNVSLVTQRLKRLPAMLETQVQSLDQEDPLEKEMATHSSILAWRIPWREEPDRLQSTGFKESDTTALLHFHFSFTVLVVKRGKERDLKG